MTFADQGLVSGTNFLTSIILARALGPVQFGEFVLILSITFFIGAVQGAIAIAPMLTLFPQTPAKDRPAFVRTAFTLQLAVVTVAAISVAVACFWGPWAAEIRSAALAIGACIWMYLQQDWLRRYLLLKGRTWEALWNDGISYLGQLIVFGVLLRETSLSLVAAVWTIAFTSALATAIGYARHRRRIRLGWRTKSFGAIRPMARDLTLSAQLHWAGTQGLFFVAAAFLGARSVGGIRAAFNVFGPFNVLALALDNVIPIKAAQSMRQSGIPGVQRVMWKSTFWIALTIGLPLTVIGLGGTRLAVSLYGNAYQAYGHFIAWGAVSTAMIFAVRQCGYTLRTVGRTSALVRGSAAALVVTIALCAGLSSVIGETALPAALVVGQGLNIMIVAAGVSRATRRAAANEIASDREIARVPDVRRVVIPDVVGENRG